MTEYFVAWWNVENLFSVEDDPNRIPWLAEKLKGELKGWTRTVLDKKLAQLAKVISSMNGGLGPDLLGVCEVENKAVLDQLVAALKPLGRAYKVVHHDTSDQRGIDVAFLYDLARFTTKAKEVFSHTVLRRTGTRDLFQASFYTKPNKNRLVVIGNHWPARSEGQYESEPYRMLAGETLSYWLERIREVLKQQATDPEPAVLVMGDFNDEPFNRSMTEYALGQRTDRLVKSKRAESPYLLNLTWPLMATGGATHVFGSERTMLDQMLANRGFFSDESPWRVKDNSTEIVLFPDHLDRNQSPRRFGRPSSRSSFDETGFSDHLPVACRIVEH
jgi:endonuclease/exonuclease/phosphatase family metal-dependent hydrolase